MAQQKQRHESNRKFGAMPEWAKTGPITVENYSYRAEAHCALKSAEREGIHPTITIESEAFPAWRNYFDQHLDGRPLIFRMLVDSVIREMTAPEPVPQWFDASFNGKSYENSQAFSDSYALPRARSRLPLPLEGPGARANLFVPTSNSHYAKLCAYAEKTDAAWWRYGSGGEVGIWVPFGWFDEAKGVR
jgi:hypothetical protein